MVDKIKEMLEALRAAVGVLRESPPWVGVVAVGVTITLFVMYALLPLLHLLWPVLDRRDREIARLENQIAALEVVRQGLQKKINVLEGLDAQKQLSIDQLTKELTSVRREANVAQQQSAQSKIELEHTRRDYSASRENWDKHKKVFEQAIASRDAELEAANRLIQNGKRDFAHATARIAQLEADAANDWSKPPPYIPDDPNAQSGGLCREICIEQSDLRAIGTSTWRASILDQPTYDRHSLRISSPFNANCGIICTATADEKFARWRSWRTGRFYFWEMPPLHAAPSRKEYRDWTEMCKPGSSWYAVMSGKYELTRCPKGETKSRSKEEGGGRFWQELFEGGENKRQ